MIIKATVEIEIPDSDAIAWLESVGEVTAVADEFEGAEFPLTMSGMRCMFRISDAEKDE